MKPKKTNQSEKLIDMGGKVMPHDKQTEKAVLAAFILEHGSYLQVASMLHEGLFYDLKNKAVFNAIRQLNSEGKIVDLVTLNRQLTNTGMIEEAGGMHYIMDLFRTVNSGANIQAHCLYLTQFDVLRKAIDLGFEIHQKAFDPETDVVEFSAWVVTQSSRLLDIQVAEKPKNINQLFKAAKEQREAILLSNDDYIGITTNILAVDNVTQGFRGGDYAVIAARPSMGKTALALQFALSAAFNDVDVMIYSYETKGVSMANRLESNLSGVPLTKVRNPKTLTNGDILDIQAGHALAERISLTIEDKPLKYEVLMNSIRKFKNNSTKKKQLVIIDYIQLIQTVEKFKDANTRITHISTNLKQLAMELDLVMMPLAQLNRGVESRGGDKRPNLADIRDCGAIEQDADTVMFLHRPHYYGQKQDDGSDYEEGYTELLFRKNRNEGVGECAIMYDMKIQRFTDLVPNTYLPESITPSAIQPNANF